MILLVPIYSFSSVTVNGTICLIQIQIEIECFNLQAARPRYARSYNLHSGLRPSLDSKQILLPFCNESTVCHIRNPSPPFEALRNVRRPHTQVDYITGNI